MSDLYNIIKTLCDKKGITGYRLCKDLKIQPSLLTELKMGRKNGMKAETADKIATYFGVSVSYLLGNTPEEIATPSITFDDFTFAMYNEGKELSDESKKMLIEMAGFLRQKQSDEESK